MTTTTTAPLDGARRGQVEFTLTAEPAPLRRLLADAWRSRALLAMLARKDFFVRYRRASFGLLWAVGLPLFQAVVLAVVFSKVARISTGGGYAVFVFAGILPWTFFSATMSAGATSIVDGSDLSTKIYFPRALLPLVPVGANLYGFVPSLGTLLLLSVAFGVHLGPELVLLVPATLLMVVFTASFATVLASLHVYFRDVRYLLQAALLGWFYVTPVIYPLDLAGWLRPWLTANPVTGLVELFRAATVGPDPGWGLAVGSTLLWTLALVMIGLALQRRFDRVFVDLL